MSEMKFFVLKVGKAVEDDVEEIAEFVREKDAKAFASAEQANEPSNGYEYHVRTSRLTDAEGDPN